MLCVIAGEIKHHGVCDLPIEGIAARAGVCRTVALKNVTSRFAIEKIKSVTALPVPSLEAA